MILRTIRILICDLCLKIYMSLAEKIQLPEENSTKPDKTQLTEVVK